MRLAEQPVSDIELLARLRAGDEGAYEILVRAHAGRLLAVAQRFLGRTGDAQDAVQEAFVAAFRSLGDFAAGARLSTWLHRILVNVCLMKLRAQRRRPEEQLGGLLPRFDAQGKLAELPREWRRSAQQLLERHETRKIVRRSIDRLPENYRTVLLLRDIEELDTEETARLLRITPNAVKIRLHRARLALRTLLAEKFAGGRP